MRSSIGHVCATGVLLNLCCVLAFAAELDSPVATNVSLAARGGYQGATVLWGGLIVDHVTESGQTCLQVVATPLDEHSGRPTHTPYSLGSNQLPGQRFFACQSSPLSESDYAIGRVVTVAGTLGIVQERVLPTSSCMGEPDLSRTAHEMTARGCTLQVPVVTIQDSRSWVAPPGQRLPHRLLGGARSG